MEKKEKLINLKSQIEKKPANNSVQELCLIVEQRRNKRQ